MDLQLRRFTLFLEEMLAYSHLNVKWRNKIIH